MTFFVYVGSRKSSSSYKFERCFGGLTGFTAPLQVTLFSGIKISLINTPGTKTIWYLFAKLKDNKVHKYLLHPPSIRKIK